MKIDCHLTVFTVVKTSTTITTKNLVLQVLKENKDDMVHALGPSLLLSAYLISCSAPLLVFLNVVLIIYHYLLIHEGRVMIFPIL